MFKCKLDINMATLKVCQAISRVEICKWIYTQLLTYKPKKWLLLFKMNLWFVWCLFMVFNSKHKNIWKVKILQSHQSSDLANCILALQTQGPSISMIWTKNESIYPILNFCTTDSLWTDSGLFSSVYWFFFADIRSSKLPYMMVFGKISKNYSILIEYIYNLIIYISALQIEVCTFF